LKLRSRVLAFCRALGWFLGYLNLAAVSLGAVFSIFAFVVLGRRVFDFFDPTQLVGYIVTKELENIWSQLSAERQIEGTLFIPDWFLLVTCGVFKCHNWAYARPALLKVLEKMNTKL